MKITKPKLVMIFIIPLVAWIAGYLLNGLSSHPPITSSDLAAWAQALGSSMAIFIAIRISDKEHQRLRQRDKDLADETVTNLLQLFLDEVEIIKDRNIDCVNGILDPALSGAVGHPIYFSDEPFSIYHAHIDRLSSIPNRELRKLLLEAYGTFTSVRTCIKTNNAYLESYTLANNAHKQNPTELVQYKQYQQELLKLDSWGPKLRSEWLKAGQRASALINALEKEIIIRTEK